MSEEIGLKSTRVRPSWKNMVKRIEKTIKNIDPHDGGDYLGAINEIISIIKEEKEKVNGSV